MKKTIRKTLQEGFIVDTLISHLNELYKESQELYPNSWDTQFLRNIIRYKKKFTTSQIYQLERLLNWKMLEEEYPNGLLLEHIQVVKNEPVQIKFSKLTKNELITAMTSLGFSPYKPRTSSWKEALVRSNNTTTIYFLFAKRSIDFKFYDYIRPIKKDHKGHLFTDGGILVRNYYQDSKINIHALIFKIAQHFCNNVPLEKGMFISHGISQKELQARQISRVPLNASDEMVLIYETISHTEGEDAYLGDGVYIRPDGTTYEA